MARRLRQHRPVAPTARVGETPIGPHSVFYPNEVARALAIEVIDYAQLRRFYRLLRDPGQTGTVPRSWSRYTFTDLAGLVTALDLCGGTEALRPGRDLVRRDLERCCKALWDQGYPNPLLNVRLIRHGCRIVVDLDGLLLDPSDGQILIRETAQQMDQFFSGSLLRDPVVAAALRAEIARHRGVRLAAR